MYLSEVFYTLLSMSISASLCTLVILILRQIPHIPKNIIRHIWIIPFVRLVFPFGLPFKYGFLELTARLTRTVAVPVEIHGTDIRTLAYNHVALVKEYVPFTYKTDMIRRIFDVACVIWVVVASVLLLFFAVSYIISIGEHKSAAASEDNIYFSKNASAPFLLGIIRPKIILPHVLSKKDNSIIIAHEKSHMKAFDNLSRLIAITVCILHWFNPFVWIFLRMYLCDLELACDERVIRGLEKNQRKVYAKTLLEYKSPASVHASGIGSSKLSKRIKNILTYRNISVISLIFIILLLVSAAVILLSNGQLPE